MFFNKNVNRAAVNDDHGPVSVQMLGIKGWDLFFGFVDDTNKFEGDLVLEIDTKMCEKEDRFFYDFHVGFEDKLFFEIGLNVVEEIFFFWSFERYTFKFIFLLFDVMFHFVAKLPWQLVVVSQFVNGLLVIVKFLVFLLDLIHRNTDNVNHVPENSSAN